MLLATDDISVYAENALDVFLEYMPHQRSRALVYGVSDFWGDDERVKRINTFLEEQRIVNFSHVTFPYSPKNKIFGVNGSHKECGLNIGIVSKEEALACLEKEDNWHGEMGSIDKVEYLPLQRLTYNPLFDEMVQEIDNFIQL